MANFLSQGKRLNLNTYINIYIQVRSPVGLIYNVISFQQFILTRDAYIEFIGIKKSVSIKLWPCDEIYNHMVILLI